MTVQRPTGAALAEHHQRGDHRACSEAECAHAARWHPLILRAAQLASERSGRPYAVLCLLCPADDGLPHVLATLSDAWSAAGLRNSHAKRRHGNQYEPDGPDGEPDYFGFKSTTPVVQDGRLR